MSIYESETLNDIVKTFTDDLEDIQNTIDALDAQIEILQERKEFFEETLPTFKTQMDIILSNLDSEQTGYLHKNRYYGVEDLQGWGWFTLLSYLESQIIYININTFTLPAGWSDGITAGSYLMLDCGNYGNVERLVERVETVADRKWVYLDEDDGMLSDPLSRQSAYIPSADEFPSCEDPGKVPERECIELYDRDPEFRTCENARNLRFKAVVTNITTTDGQQQVDLEGGIDPFQWTLTNDEDFTLTYLETNNRRNVLIWEEYEGLGTTLTVTDYCGRSISVNIGG